MVGEIKDVKMVVKKVFRKLLGERAYFRLTSMGLRARKVKATPKDAVQKALSIIVPVYATDSTEFVDRLICHYVGFSMECKKRFRLILVDDGSPVKIDLADVKCNISLYRILENIPWNQPGARNLGVMCADTENILFTDADHFFPEETIEKLLDAHLAEKEIWKFDRWTNGRPIRPHPCTFFMSKRLYIKLNGFEEDLAGRYGHDDIYFIGCVKALGAKMRQTDLRVLLFADGTEQHTLQRDCSHNASVVEKRKTDAVGLHSRKMLRFKWEFVGERFVSE